MNRQHSIPIRFAVASGSVVALVCSAPVRGEGQAPVLSPISVNLLDIAPSAAAGGVPVSRDTTVHLRGFGIYSSANGSINYGNDVSGVTNNIDLESTLGMDLDKFTGGIQLGFNLPPNERFHLDFSYNGYYDYSGDKNVGSIAYNGKVFTASVKSTVRLQEGAVTTGFDIWRSDGTGLTITPTLGLHLFYVDSKLAENLTPLSDSTKLWVPIPDVGLALRWDITPNLFVRGGASGFWVGDIASYFSAGAEVGYDFNKNVGVFLGYRYWLFDFDYEGDSVHFDAGSAYAGVELRI